MRQKHSAVLLIALGMMAMLATLSCPAQPCLISQLGPAGSFSILGLQGARLQLSSGPLQVNGNVGIGANGTLQFSGGTHLNGTLYYDPTASVQISGGSSFNNGEVSESFTAIDNAALAESNAAALRTPTQTFSQIQNATTIAGDGGQNVIAVTGNFHLSGGNNLTISGGPNDTFIINVYQGLQMDSGTSIVLDGVSPSQVLFNFIGNQQFQTSGNADTAGIFLGINASQQVQINGGVHNSVFIFASNNFSFQSNPQVNTIECIGPQPLTLICPVRTGQLGVPYSSSLVATGGTPPYTYEGISGGVPGIPSLNFTTGLVAGTPNTAGTFAWEFGVTDSAGNMANTGSQCEVTVTVTPALPTACVIPPSGTAIPGSPVSWNGFTAPAGSVVWINAHLDASNVPTNTITTVDFTGVSLVVNTTTYALPNGQVVFNPAVSTPTTVVNADGSWTTTVNPTFNNDIFFDGQAIPVDSNLENGGHGNTGSTLSFSTNSNDSALKFQWQWGAAVYTSWPGNAAANIEPVHAAQQAGAPLNTAVEKNLIQGPRGGGGSNFTGSWSGTGQGTCGGAGGTGTGGSGGNGTLAAPRFSPPAGTYTSAQSVTIGLPSGATGCYTVDGTTPTATTSGTCSNGSTYSSSITVAATENINVLATESGWTNSSVASAVYTINSSTNSSYPTYSDNFNRANGSLGSNWAEPDGAGAGLQIINDLVYAASVPVTHAFEIYTAGTFDNNQWTSFLVESNGNTSSGQGAIVRATTSSNNFYNDGIFVGSDHIYRLGNQPSVDFCAVDLKATYAVGDTHELDVAGSGPVFFWSKHNGTVDATCYDNTYNYTAGTPGLGMADDPNTSPTVANGAWQGGSLPSFSNTPSDNFARANAGWLGVNWWFVPPTDSNGLSSFFILSNNAAVLSIPTGAGIAMWTTPFNTNHSSAINVGSQSSGWVGAVTRLTPGANGAATFYLALAEPNGTVDLFAFNNGIWELLSSETYGGAINTIELDATGTSPVALAIKINGTQFGGAYSDSTHNYTGTYVGFAMAGTGTSSMVTGWQGSNL
jgi:Chitobiase/beta-hexosaminidase C-terminal domain